MTLPAFRRRMAAIAARPHAATGGVGLARRRGVRRGHGDHGRAARVLFSLFDQVAGRASASPPDYLPHTFSLENYLKVATHQAGLASYVGNSTLVALMTIAACIALAAPAGYGLARFSLLGKEIAFLVLLAPMMIPYQALLTPLYLDFAKVGLVNSRIGLAIVHTILQLPFSIYLMRNSFEAIPRRSRKRR